MTLVKSAWVVPDEIDFGTDKLLPLRAGAIIAWKID
jgi:dihydroorotase